MIAFLRMFLKFYLAYTDEMRSILEVGSEQSAVLLREPTVFIKEFLL